MERELLAPLFIFAFTMSITPGPNNIMLTASGANFGYWRTLPHIIGIILGIVVLNVLSALGLHKLFEHYPVIQKGLKMAGVSYLLFLAYKIARADEISDNEAKGKPLNLVQAMLFQALNPKAVITTITAMTLYTLGGDRFIYSVYTVILVFMVTGFLCISVWALFGSFIKRILKHKRYLRIFNYSMGTLCALSAVLLLK